MDKVQGFELRNGRQPLKGVSGTRPARFRCRAESISERSRSRHRRFLAAAVALGCAVVITSASCGGSERSASTSSLKDDATTTEAGRSGSDSTRDLPQQPVDHQTDLSTGESPFLAAYVVPVDGYSYADADEFEIDATIELLDSIERDNDYDYFGAVSLHSVVADDPSQNTARTQARKLEVGFLGLVQLNDVVPAGLEEEVASNARGSMPIERLEMSGVPVFLFEAPDSVDSRYTYSWFEHGAHAFIDGADREPLERWIAAYRNVPKLAPNETARLDALLVPLEGFTYANFDPAIQPEINESLGQYPYSAHRIADTEDAIGTLLLVDTPDPTPFDELMNTLGFTKTATDEYDGVAIYFWESTDNPDFEFMEWSLRDDLRAGLAFNNADTDPASEFVAELWLADR